MEAYAPLEAWRVGAALALSLLSIAFGRTATRFDSPVWTRLASWAWALGATLAAERILASEPAGLRMLLICWVLLVGMKVVVGAEEAMAGRARLGPLEWLAFAAGWPGMKPEQFAGALFGEAREGWAALLRSGVLRLVLGLMMLGLARGLSEMTDSPWAATPALLVGLSLTLHFGLFDLAAGLWRRLGARVEKLFPAPLAATSLGEFWGRRWNKPFSEMTQRAVYFPLNPRIGRGPAALAGFVFSGLLHELAISVPVQAGFGLPSLYFVLHGGLILIERRAPGFVAWLEAHPAWGRAWTILWLAAPMPILFHPPFLEQVVWPIIGIAAT